MTDNIAPIKHGYEMPTLEPQDIVTAKDCPEAIFNLGEKEWRFINHLGLKLDDNKLIIPRCPMCFKTTSLILTYSADGQVPNPVDETITLPAYVFFIQHPKLGNVMTRVYIGQCPKNHVMWTYKHDSKSLSDAQTAAAITSPKP